MTEKIVAFNENRDRTGLPAPLEGRLDATYAGRQDTLAGPAPLGMFAAALAARETGPVVIVGTGSSTTQGNGASADHLRWFNQFANAVHRSHPLASGDPHPLPLTLETAVEVPPSDPGIHFVNAAVGGTNTATFLTDVTGPQVAALDPDVIIHMVGTNDFRIDKPIYDFTNDFVARLDQLDQDAATPILHVIVRAYEVSGDSYTEDGTLHTWDEYGEAMRSVAEARADHALYVDLSEAYARAGVPGDDPHGMLTSDLVHQNDRGHTLMADLMMRAMKIPPAPTSVAATPSRPQIPIAWDTFDRPDGSLDGQIAPTGQEWKAWDRVPRIIGGRAQSDSGSATAALNSGSPDHDVSCVVDILGTIGYPVFLFRSLGLDDRLGATIGVSGGTLLLQHVVGGESSNVATASGVDTSAGEHIIRAICQGRRVQIFWDGARIIDHTFSEADAAAMDTWTHVGWRSLVGQAAWSDFRIALYP